MQRRIQKMRNSKFTKPLLFKSEIYVKHVKFNFKLIVNRIISYSKVVLLKVHKVPKTHQHITFSSILVYCACVIGNTSRLKLSVCSFSVFFFSLSLLPFLCTTYIFVEVLKELYSIISINFHYLTFTFTFEVL